MTAQGLPQIGTAGRGRMVALYDDALRPVLLTCSPLKIGLRDRGRFRDWAVIQSIGSSGKASRNGQNVGGRPGQRPAQKGSKDGHHAPVTAPGGSEEQKDVIVEIQPYKFSPLKDLPSTSAITWAEEAAPLDAIQPFHRL